MSQPKLSSLDDALLDRILHHLVESQGTRTALKAACLINKRFAALVKQPLAAWGCLTPHIFLPSDALAHLSQWLVAVAPAVRQLRLSFEGVELDTGVPCHIVDTASFLPRMPNLQVTAKLLFHYIGSVLFTFYVGL